MWGVFACWGRGGEVEVVEERQRERGKLVEKEAVASRWLVGCRVHGDGGSGEVGRWDGGVERWKDGRGVERWRSEEYEGS